MIKYAEFNDTAKYAELECSGKRWNNRNFNVRTLHLFQTCSEKVVCFIVGILSPF